MHDHNLEDLILDPKHTGTGKAKGLLSLLALVVVVLMAGILLYKTFLSEPPVARVVSEENVSAYVSPELEPAAQEPEEISVPAPKAPVANRRDATPPATPVKPTPPKTPHVVTSDEVVEIPAAPVEPKKRQRTKPTAVTKPTPKPAVKKNAAPAKPKRPHTAAATEKKRYYIQVASYSRKPSSDARLLQVVRRNGYDYTLYKASNGMYKVLIGPYKNRREVDHAIQTVRSRINKQAFVYTMKR